MPDLLDPLLDAWHQARDRGVNVPAAELCRDHPDLLPELERRLAVLRRIAALATAETVDRPAPADAATLTHAGDAGGPRGPRRTGGPPYPTPLPRRSTPRRATSCSANSAAAAWG